MFVAMTRRTKAPDMSILEAILARELYRNEKNKAELEKNKEIAESLYNAILVQDVFFGIVRDELDKALKPILANFNITEPTMHWMRESAYVFYSATNFQQMTTDEENKLYLAMKAVRSAVRNQSLAFNAKLCLVDENVEYILKVNERDLGGKTTEGGTKAEPSFENNSFSLLDGAT